MTSLRCSCSSSILTGNCGGAYYYYYYYYYYYDYKSMLSGFIIIIKCLIVFDCVFLSYFTLPWYIHYELLVFLQC